MSRSEKVKVALDETRTLVLGCQVLVGFQFQAGFQSAFHALPDSSKIATVVALLLLMSSLAGLIAPVVQHAVIDRYDATGRIERAVTRAAFVSLLPLAVALAFDMAIAMERVLGTFGGIAGGAVFGALSGWCWYGREFRDRLRHGRSARAQAEARRDVEVPVSQKINYMLTEARTILPGVQAILGFQLVVVFTSVFGELPIYARWLHIAALGCSAISIVLLMAPAAYHRIVYAGEDSERFLDLGGRMVFAATVPLAVGLAADCTVAVEKILHSTRYAIGCGAAVLLGLVVVWHVAPVVLRHIRTRTP